MEAEKCSGFSWEVFVLRFGVRGILLKVTANHS